MTNLLRAIVAGEWLRHRAVRLTRAEQRPVRAVARSAAGERDVTSLIYPISLTPMLIGIARPPHAGPTETDQLTMREVGGENLGTLNLLPAGMLEHPRGRLDLFRPVASAVFCVPTIELGWRYAKAWRHTRTSPRRGEPLQMTFADLKALNVLYMMPRPVYLVTAQHGDRGNMFPMDLVGPCGEDTFHLALRASSRSVETICSSGRIALAGVPARMKESVYRLGGQHRKRSLDWRTLDLVTKPSPRFDFPVASEAIDLHELEVQHSVEIGSHRFFVTSVVHHEVCSDEQQLCHVSDMYARWRAVQGRPFLDA